MTTIRHGEPPWGGDRPTRLDGPAMSTRLENVAPPSTRLEQAPRTRVEGMAQRPTRVNLPWLLAERYEALADIGRRGAEADLLLVEERNTGKRQVVKLYRQSTRGVDREMLDRVREANEAHVVQLLDSGEDEGLPWEVLEHCELGSLEDLLVREATQLRQVERRKALASEVFVELARAINHVHRPPIQCAHRDIKPANVLVRTRKPLDLVLADFGLATVMEASHVLGTSSRTIAYAAPEAAAGGLYETSDWWSLGIVIAEVLLGRHPLALPDGTLPREAQIHEEIATRPVDLSDIEDGHWRLLCRGLLTRNPKQRWSTPQVVAWGRGESPPVAGEEAVRPAAPRTKRVMPFSFRDPETGREREFTDPVELANALASDWDAAARLVQGNDQRELRTFRDFLESCDLLEAERILAGDESPEGKLVRILVRLDPDIEPTFRGLSIDREGVRMLASEALSEQARADTVTAIYEDRVLRHYSTETGDRSDYASIDTAWHRNATRLKEVLASLNVIPHQLRPAVLAAGRARALLTLVDSKGIERLRQETVQVRSDSEARQQPWFRVLADRPPDDGEIGQLVMLLLLHGEAVAASRRDAERRRQEELAREQAEEAARQAQKEGKARRRRDRRAANARQLRAVAANTVRGFAAGFLAWLPVNLGRTEVSWPPGVIETSLWALVLGVPTVVALLAIASRTVGSEPFEFSLSTWFVSSVVLLIPSVIAAVVVEELNDRQEEYVQMGLFCVPGVVLLAMLASGAIRLLKP